MAISRLLPAAIPLTVTIDGGTLMMQRLVWLVFVGNNAYGSDIFHPMARRELDRSRLDVVVVPAVPRRELVRLMEGRGAGPRMRTVVDQLRISACEPAVHAVACDGEVLPFDPPFVFRSVPQALQVLAPSPRAMETEAARRGFPGSRTTSGPLLFGGS